MTDNRTTGIALIAGSLGAVLTMIMHPTAAGVVTRPEYQRLALVSGTAHGIAIGSVALLFLGACGLTRRLQSPNRVAYAALVVFGIAAIGAINAATISGFIEPAMMLRMVRDTPAAAEPWRVAVAAVFEANQAFARIFAIGASVAVMLWSVVGWREQTLGRTLSIYGCVIPLLLIVGVSIGHLRMDIHGIGLTVVAQAVWFVAAGAQLLRRLRR